MKINFNDVQLLGIDDTLPTQEEMKVFAKNIAIAIWKEATDPVLSDIGKKMFAEGEAEVTLQQLESIKQIVEKNSLQLPPVTVRYTISYLNSI